VGLGAVMWLVFTLIAGGCFVVALLIAWRTLGATDEPGDDSRPVE
jgi:hypothetical protein